MRGAGMNAMVYATSTIKSISLGNSSALPTYRCVSGGISRLFLGQCSEATVGGVIGLLRHGERIRINILNRTIDVLISDGELAQRRADKNDMGWRPAEARPRKVLAALKAYGLLATSADKVRCGEDLSQLKS
jgi:dihydroxy-acid dehydratase